MSDYKDFRDDLRAIERGLAEIDESLGRIANTCQAILKLLEKIQQKG